MHTRSSKYAVVSLLMGCLVAISTRATAQVTGQVAVGGGSATDARGVHSNVATVAPSLTLTPDPNATLSFNGNATAFTNSSWSLGGGTALASRAAIPGGFALTMSADGSGQRTSYDATLAVADLTPAMEWSWSSLTLFGGVHGAAGYTAVTQTTSTPQGIIPVPGETTQLVSVSRTAYAPIYGGQLHFAGADPTTALQISYKEEPMRVSGVLVIDRTAGAAILVAPVTIAMTAGARRAVDENVNFASGTLNVALSRGMAIEVGGGSYPSNRLTGAAGGNFVSAGLGIRIGGVHEASALPAVRGVQGPAAGMTRLAIRAEGATRVELAGDWSNWQPVAAARAENGVWYADVQLAPGQYRYAFRVDGREWRVPEGIAAVDDGFGGKSAYVTVRGDGHAQP